MINPGDEIINGNPKYNFINNIDGTVSIELANEVIQQGTALNKKSLNDIMGMGNKTTTFNNDGSITETDGEVTKTTIFNSDGSITERVSGGDGLTTIKRTVFNSDGSISENLIEEVTE